MSLSAASAFPPVPAQHSPLLAALRREKSFQAIREQAADPPLLDLALRSVTTPVGEVTLVATGIGLARVEFDFSTFSETYANLRRHNRVVADRSAQYLATASAELTAYFEGKRAGFRVPLDLGDPGPFHLSVLRYLGTLTWGRTLSYAELARALGRPRATRAVGAACIRNPLPIVLPSHRILRSDGSLGAHPGGPRVKHALLEHEGALAAEVPRSPATRPPERWRHPPDHPGA